jgi:hypothetical protein
LCRRLAEHPRVGDIAPDLSWDLPLRFLGGLHYLVLAGKASWDDLDAALEEHAAFLTRWAAEQDVQTNEVQRSWGLLPGFLTLADGRPFDLLELGPSGGLNLVWDHYRYRYSVGAWGDGPLELTGDDRIPPPAELFERHVEVARRRGIDLNPVDVTTEHGARLLHAFIWPGRVERAQRLKTAIAILRREPPTLVRGDYVELLPAVLAERDQEALTIVFQIASTGYIGRERRAELRELLEQAGREGPLGWVSTRAVEELEEDRTDSYELEVGLWPGGERRLLLRCDFHGNWIRWRS